MEKLRVLVLDANRHNTNDTHYNGIYFQFSRAITDRANKLLDMLAADRDNKMLGDYFRTLAEQVWYMNHDPKLCDPQNGALIPFDAQWQQYENIVGTN